MVSVRKKNSHITICINFKHLNEIVKQEQYIIPIHDSIPRKLKGVNSSVNFMPFKDFGKFYLKVTLQKVKTFIGHFD